MRKPKNPSRERFELSLDKIADKDIVKHLAKIPNKSDYVRQLIRQDIKKSA